MRLDVSKQSLKITHRQLQIVGERFFKSPLHSESVARMEGLENGCKTEKELYLSARYRVKDERFARSIPNLIKRVSRRRVSNPAIRCFIFFVRLRDDSFQRNPKPTTNKHEDDEITLMASANSQHRATREHRVLIEIGKSGPSLRAFLRPESEN